MRERCASAVGLVLLALVACAVGAGSAQAHAMPTSAVLLDIGPDFVSGEVEMPLDRLAVAQQRPISAAQAAGPDRAALESYARRHLSVTGPDGARWSVWLRNGRVEQISDAPAFVLDLTFTPPAGKPVTTFRISYDIIIEQLATHRALVSVRSDFTRGDVSTDSGGRLVGVLDWNHTALVVSAAGGSTLSGVAAMTRLGLQHVVTGADHLLFLVMLLLAAPLVARRRRWARGDSVRRTSTRVAHTVTAFAVGHSITLALAALGVLRVPPRPVEVLIAASIAMSALHAVRPLVRGGEVFIVGGFGLIHGLAFASALNALALTRGSLLLSLFAFNVGIEVAQLLLVVLVMPSLLLLARTRWYRVFRSASAAIGLTIAGTWVLERAGVTRGDPFAPFTQWSVEHPLVVVGGLALFAVAARVVAPATTGSPTAAIDDPGGPKTTQDPATDSATRPTAPLLVTSEVKGTA